MAEFLDYPGNLTPAPGFHASTQYTDDEVLYSSVQGSFSQRSITLKPGQGILLAGTLLKKDPGSALYVRATESDAAVVLRKNVNTGTSPDTEKYQASVLTFGLLKLTKLQAANSGVTFADGVLGGRINADLGFFKF